jgi:deazaflavin-dependent oxidoreductase (nitroreductase family)
MSENRDLLDGRNPQRKRMALAFWRVANRLARPVAGVVPWWVLLETTGRRSGQPRRVPLARGPIDGRVAWLISVHGVYATFVRNLQADPRVRLKLRGRWRVGTAAVEEMDDRILRQFNLYAGAGPRYLGIEPRLVRVEADM